MERVSEQSEQLNNKHGKLYAYKCDITIEDEIISTFKTIISELGDIHILINNAGILRATNLMDGETEKWKAVIGRYHCYSLYHYLTSMTKLNNNCDNFRYKRNGSLYRN